MSRQPSRGSARGSARPAPPQPPSPPEGTTPSLRPITSARNPWVRLARALDAKKVRRERRLLVAEGEDLVEAALDHGLTPQAVLVDAARADEIGPLLDRMADLPERYAVPSDLMGHVAVLASTPRVIAIVPQPGPYGFNEVRWPPRMGVWLAGVADPGNVGTLVRSAAALGADWVALGPGSADPYHPRALRAAMGATFALPLLESVRAEDLATRTGFQVVAAAVVDGKPPWDVDLTRPTVLALGAERAGIDPALDALSRGGVEVSVTTIPQDRRTESLNVSAAGAVLMGEALRQREVQGRGLV